MLLKKKTNSFKIGAYIRVSTEEQAENPEGSIKNQEDRIRMAVEYKSRTGDFGEIVEVFTDAGISAKNMKRPRLQDLLRAIRNKEIDLVMVTELSRLSRNTRDFIQIWDLMQKHGCRFTSLREDFDTTNAAGELVLFQLMNLAQFERRQTSERVEANLQARAARGLYNGGPVPAGYKINTERPGYLLVDDDMAEVIRAAFRIFIQEGTLAKAVIWLNDEGRCLRKQMEGGGHLKRSGIFTIDNLQAILRNKTYLGIRVYKVKDESKECRSVWSAIVDEMTFRRVGEILDKNRTHLKPLGNKKKLPYILTGITHCMVCQNAMSGKSATGNGGKVGYYEHSWATKRDSGLSKKLFQCNPHRVPAKKLEPLVWQEFQKFVLDEFFAKEVFAKVLGLNAANPKNKDADRIKAKLHGLHSQIEALAERLAELPKSVSAGPIYRQLERLENLKKENEQELARVKTKGRSSKDRLASLESFESFAARYRKLVLSEMDADQRKQVLQKFIRRVEVGTETVRIHFIVDKDSIEEGLILDKAIALKGKDLGALASNFDFSSDFLKIDGSNTLTNGARGGT